MGRAMLPVWKESGFWDEVRAGLEVEDAARAAGVSDGKAKEWFRVRGGVKPPQSLGRPERYLSFREREDIAMARSHGDGVRTIARQLGRSPSTVSRELRRLPARISRADRPSYRASTAQADADVKARRPKLEKLAAHPRLCEQVRGRLNANHSPEQIAGRLRLDYPDDPEMWVSTETIYQSLFVKTRGALEHELVTHLRSGRRIRKPRRKHGERRGRIPDMVNIRQRPPEVEDRAVPGHWEGDLILGTTRSASAIGTLVERVSDFAMLLHLPGRHGASEVADAMIEKMSALSEHLRRTVTWDQGVEMAEHVRIAQATDLEIYFCDPHSPWQRGTNENTNGLLRQYFPKGSDLHQYGAGYLDMVATELNDRPRKHLGWATPAETLTQILNEQTPPSVATTT